jgi:hypothetical protein
MVKASAPFRGEKPERLLDVKASQNLENCIAISQVVVGVKS